MILTISLRCTDTSRAPSRLRAFTLIELLIVIAVIALLVGLALPVLSAARESGRKSQCVSQLKQLHHAIVMYSEDYSGYFPFAVTFDQEYRGRYIPGIRSTLQPYVKNGDIFLCPSLQWDIWRKRGIGYEYFADLAGIHDTEALGGDRLLSFTHPYPLTGPWVLSLSVGELKIRSVSDPVSMPVLADINPGHFGRLNVVWVDGHVSALRTNNVKRLLMEKPTT